MLKHEFGLDRELKKLIEASKTLNKDIKKAIDENALLACQAMEEAAKRKTPHEGDGKARGFNVISNSLQSSWVAKYKPSRGKYIGKVILTNDKPYAPFVQYGHRVTKHFVPWLYKDGMGTLSYETNHNQPLFGLVVGTKTQYVKGVKMIEAGQSAFNRKFNQGMDKFFKKYPWLR